MAKETEVAKTQPTQTLVAWKDAVAIGMHKFSSISDPAKAKVEAGFAAQIIEGSPTLQNYALTPVGKASIINSIINVARMSLTLNPAMKLAYLIPRGGKCVLDTSYMGLMKILTDGGDVKYVSAAIVYEDEEFQFIDATNVKHVPIYPKTEEEQNKRIVKGALSCAILKDDTKVFEFMPNYELQKIKRMSAAAASSSSPYKDWGSEMMKKAVIRRHYKSLPKGNSEASIAAAQVIMEQEKEFAVEKSSGDVFGETVDVESTDVTNDTAAK